MQHNERRKTSRHKSMDEINYNLEINIYFDNAFQKRDTKPKAYQDTKRRVKYNRNQDFEYKVRICQTFSTHENFWLTHNSRGLFMSFLLMRIDDILLTL